MNGTNILHLSKLCVSPRIACSRIMARLLFSLHPLIRCDLANPLLLQQGQLQIGEVGRGGKRLNNFEGSGRGWERRGGRGKRWYTSLPSLGRGLSRCVGANPSPSFNSVRLLPTCSPSSKAVRLSNLLHRCSFPSGVVPPNGELFARLSCCQRAHLLRTCTSAGPHPVRMSSCISARAAQWFARAKLVILKIKLLKLNQILMLLKC